MKLSELTQEGIEKFTNFLDEIETIDFAKERDEILNDARYCISVSDVTCVAVEQFPETKYEAAQYLFNLLEGSEIENLDKNVGLWSFLYLHYLEKVSTYKKGSGIIKKEQLAKGLLHPNIYNRYYKHKLAGPYYVYKAQHEDPSVLRAVLSGTLRTPGEVYEALASRQEFVTNQKVLQLACELYYDDKAKKLKKGAATKSKGAARRLGVFHLQFSRTWDLYGVTLEKLQMLLPKEFSRFVN